MNVAAVDSGGNLVAFQRMDGAMLASIQIAEHKARAAVTFRRPTKVFEDGIQVMHLNYLLAFDGIIASRGGIPLIEQWGLSAQSVVREARIPRMRSSARQARQ
jgi:glc operon protein GlcG